MTLNDSDRRKLLKASLQMERFSNEFKALSQLWQECMDGEYASYDVNQIIVVALNQDYPLDGSFTEAMQDITLWIDETKEILDSYLT